ncbi:substrate-binding periplasmic protein [Roseitranquillus sediminis]|uniref:substrate-binding periplasmic protein n=1 Tax=Roseitranquillus sediminis TaxID=2809051 RepID=UPI001D0C01AE|nr:transporter substrate-binding domain-containing protein [Roseitranquillus sediminis]MBM9595949.1 transporter substrate-binding domain-containing protein [Roseitranquillus sediminis]
MLRHLALATTAAACLLSAAQGLRAQVGLPYVPPEWHQEQRWLEGSKVTFCLWSVSPTMEIDRRIGEAIGEALLLEADFQVYENRVPLLGEQFWEEVWIQLAERCDAIAGFVMSADLDVDWLIPTRPYYEAPYVFAVRDDGISRLGDVPADGKVGSMIYTPADTNLISYMELQPEDRRWTRYPFTSGEQALDFLQSDRVAGSIFWAPTLRQVTGGDPGEMGIRQVPLDPVSPTSTPIGMMLREHNVFLRNEIDRAIGALIEDGVIEDILEETGWPGQSGAS